MAIAHFKREGQKLVPADQQSLDRIMKFSEGDIISGDFKKARNYEFHKKFFALINLLWDNSPMNIPFNTFRAYAIAISGHGSVVNGVAIADSISFDNMDEIEFQELYKDILQFGVEHTGADREFIENNLLSFM